MTSQITGVSTVCSTVCSGASNAGLVTRKMFPFDDVIMHVNNRPLLHDGFLLTILTKSPPQLARWGYVWIVLWNS